MFSVTAENTELLTVACICRSIIESYHYFFTLRPLRFLFLCAFCGSLLCATPAVSFPLRPLRFLFFLRPLWFPFLCVLCGSLSSVSSAVPFLLRTLRFPFPLSVPSAFSFPLCPLRFPSFCDLCGFLFPAPSAVPFRCSDFPYYEKITSPNYTDARPYYRFYLSAQF